MKAEIVTSNESMDCINLFPNANGSIKRIGFKTIKGLCYQLKRINKNCKKFGFKTKIEVILPIEVGR